MFSEAASSARRTGSELGERQGRSLGEGWHPGMAESVVLSREAKLILETAGERRAAIQRKAGSLAVAGMDRASGCHPEQSSAN